MADFPILSSSHKMTLNDDDDNGDDNGSPKKSDSDGSWDDCSDELKREGTATSGDSKGTLTSNEEDGEIEMRGLLAEQPAKKKKSAARHKKQSTTKTTAASASETPSSSQGHYYLDYADDDDGVDPDDEAAPTTIHLTPKNVCGTLVLFLAVMTVLLAGERTLRTTTKAARTEQEQQSQQPSYDDDVDDDWHDNQDYYYTTAAEKQKLEVRRIAILGERNSGVRWLTRLVQQCYPQLEVTASLTRPAHLFQSRELYNPIKPTVVVSLYLNPYHWVEAMRTFPRYMPHHTGLDWKDFVSKPWTMESRPDRDKEYLKQHSVTDTNCQSNFSYHEIMSCVKGEEDNDVSNGTTHDHNPMYELDVHGWGEAYGSITELRAAKIHNWNKIMNWPNITYFISLKYEHLTADGGFQFVMKELEMYVDKKAEGCDLTASEDGFRAPQFWKEELEPEYVEYLNANIDWEQEMTIGYEIPLE